MSKFFRLFSIQKIIFLLKLEFVGHRDNGQMFGSSEALNKYFVIQFTEVNFSTNESGSNYKCKAVPANHTGFTNVAQQIVNNIKLRGENIKEMLVAGNTSLCSVLNKAQLDLVKKSQDTADQYIIVFPEMSLTGYCISDLVEDDLFLKTNKEMIFELAKETKDIAAIVGFIDFDNDLGPPEAGEGIDVAKWIEEQAFNNKIKPLEWRVHSMNPKGQANITSAMRSAEIFWKKNELV
jgi:hypothetical protein